LGQRLADGGRRDTALHFLQEIIGDHKILLHASRAFTQLLRKFRLLSRNRRKS
jgi:hypothetical protein